MLGGIEEGVSMDKIDRNLLVLVQYNGRGSYASYGERVGLSAAAVHDRLKKLERNGALRHWSAAVAPDLIGASVMAFVRIQVDLPVNIRALSDCVVAMPEVLECHQLGGEWSCLIKIRTASEKDLDTLVASTIAELPGVIRLQTERVRESVKESHILPVPGATISVPEGWSFVPGNSCR